MAVFIDITYCVTSMVSRYYKTRATLGIGRKFIYGMSMKLRVKIARENGIHM